MRLPRYARGMFPSTSGMSDKAKGCPRGLLGGSGVSEVVEI
jgi:hypothetical protein